jgi:hypothetical protein
MCFYKAATPLPVPLLEIKLADLAFQFGVHAESLGLALIHQFSIAFPDAVQSRENALFCGLHSLVIGRELRELRIRPVKAAAA